MIFTENYSLKKLNSFHTDVYARYFAVINNTDELIDFFADKSRLSHPLLILGGGNNILFTKDFEGYVLKINFKGKEIIYEDADYIHLKISAGEDWDELVTYCVENNWAGLENLSLIPGQVGSCPIQNIGAYGVEVKDTIVEVNTFNINTQKIETFSKSECQFGYRNSIFKNNLNHTHIITSVTFKLNKNPVPNTCYEAIRKELDLKNIFTPTIKDIRQIVCNIRQNKLPDPNVIGNAGSFFKNPVVPEQIFKSIKRKFFDVVAYKSDNNHYKLAAGWLIEKCGWKGYREGDAGVHEKQALVLVNYGHANGSEILNLAGKIKQNIFDTFNVELEFEVKIL